MKRIYWNRTGNFILVTILILSLLFYLFYMSRSKSQNKTNYQYSYGINVKEYGAFGDGRTDDTSAIQKAINELSREDDIVYFPPGQYLIRAPIVLKSGIYKGKRNTSRIVIKEEFYLQEFLPGNQCAIHNEGFSTVYDETAADNITIADLTFEMTRQKGDQLPFDILLFGNIRRLEIKNCSFYALGSGDITQIDLYTCCKNINIVNNSFENNTGAVGGGCIWVKNHSYDGSMSQNETCNVRVDSNKFIKNSNDEIIAVYGRDGTTRDVRFVNNYCKVYGYRPDVIASIFAREDNGSKWAQVSDVEFKDNVFDIGDFKVSVIQVGQTTNARNSIRNIVIKGNKIHAGVSHTRNTVMVRVNSNDNTKDVTVSGNTIANIKDIPVQSAIQGAYNVTGNTIQGRFTVAIRDCEMVVGNRIERKSKEGMSE